MNCECPPPDIRQVSDWLLRQETVNPTLDLFAENSADGDVKFVESFIKAIRRVQLTPTGKDGSYLWLYHPSNDHQTEVAVKIMNPQMQHFSDYTSCEEMLNVAHQPFLFRIDGKTINKFGDLTPMERNFLLMATVHFQYQKLFPEFVLPSVFISYKIKQDIYSNHQSDLQSKTISEVRTGSGFQIFAQIQNYSPVTPLDWGSESLSVDQIEQLSHFARRIVEVHKQGGPYPDAKLFDKKNSNLGFTQAGRLLLVDTNHFMSEEYFIKPKHQAILDRYINWSATQIQEYNRQQMSEPVYS